MVSQKGGTGKSTLARLFARELAQDGFTVKIADLDTQQTTSTEWATDRAKAGIEPEIQVQSFGNLKMALAEAERFDACILDGLPEFETYFPISSRLGPLRLQFTNRSSLDLNVRLEALGPEGRLVLGPDIVNPASLPVGQGEQVSVAIEAVFGSGILEVEAGTIAARTRRAETGAIFLLGDDQTRGGSGAASQPPRTRFLLPSISREGEEPFTKVKVFSSAIGSQWSVGGRERLNPPLHGRYPRGGGQGFAFKGRFLGLVFLIWLFIHRSSSSYYLFFNYLFFNYLFMCPVCTYRRAGEVSRLHVDNCPE